MAVDLSEVAPTGSAEADRQTAVFYMVARQMLTRDWWTGPDEMNGGPGAVSGLARRAGANIEGKPRSGSPYDEFSQDRGPRSRSARRSSATSREARKMRVRLVLASQRIEDFGPALVELANPVLDPGRGRRRPEKSPAWARCSGCRAPSPMPSGTG